MRLITKVMLLTLVLGAPIVMAPKGFLIGQAFAITAEQQALADEITAAGDDLNKVAAIISREMSSGNFDGLAIGLSTAARNTAGSDVSLAATLMTQAIAVADSTSDATQQAVGSAASFVATTATNAGNTSAAATVDNAIVSALDADMQTAFTNAGGTSNPNVGTGTTGDTTTTAGDDTTTTGDDPTAAFDPTAAGDDTTTPTGSVTPPAPGLPPPPPNPGTVNIPVPVEPNPNPSGSPV